MRQGDFTDNPRLLWVAALAAFIGCVCAFVTAALLWVIGARETTVSAQGVLTISDAGQELGLDGTRAD